LEIAVEIRNLTKIYPSGIVANDRLTLEVPEGIIMAILGPNGAGKTTLLRQVSTELLPTSGTVQVAGYDVVKEAEAVKKVIGAMPQEFLLFAYPTVWEHIYWFGMLKGLSRSEAARQARELIHEFGLGDYQKQTIERLSGGMKRRVMICVAMIGNAKILLLDEPTTGLDPVARRSMWDIIKSKRDMGITIFLTTHYMEEADELADQVAVINHGKIIACGSPEEIKAQTGATMRFEIYQNEFRTIQEIKTVLEQIGLMKYVVENEKVVVPVQRLNDQVSSLMAYVVENQLRASISRVGLEDAYIQLMEGT
jgi:ABC-2 type transport system ATP-binding protein